MSRTPHAWRRPRPGIAVASVAAATALTAALWPLLTPIITSLFFAALVVSSWFGGMGPEVAALARRTEAA
jgi:hypothetical protein